MIVTQLQTPPPAQVQRVALEAEDSTPDFLSIKLVNKRARVKLSPRPVDLAPIPSKAQLFTIANGKGWFAAVVHNLDGSSSVVCSPLADLRSQLSSLEGESAEAFRPQRTLPLPGVVPNHVTFACNESRLLVGLVSGPILVFDAAALCTAGESGVSPLHTFPSTTSTGARHICPNPGDIPELVAVLREADGQPDSQLVEVLNVMTMQSVAGWRSGGSSDTFPTSLSWSPKGKQLAIGLQSGDIISFSPTDPNSVKSFIPKPPTANNRGVIHATWLSNPAFYTIYADPGPLDPQADQSHMIVSFDNKRSTATDVSLPLSFFPTGIRPPGAFTVALRNWDPAKILVVVGDSTTADIGVIGCVATSPGEEKWQRLSLDESATPTMPLDAESNETTMIGFELDLKNTQPFTHMTASGETVDVPPPPIMYAFASDGTLTGWYIVNTRGTPYPGMLADASASQPASQPTASASPTPVPTASPFGQPAPTTSPFGQAAPSAFGQPATSAFGQPTQSAFGQPAQPAFGQASAFGSQTTPAFGQTAFGGSSFGQPSAFGQSSGSTFGKSAFGQASGSAFGQTSSPFGQTAAPATSSTGGAFSSFATAGPAKFGQAGFGAATPMAATPTSPSPAQMERSESVDMATDNAPSFGGLSLGGDSSSSQPREGFGTAGLFGAAASQPAAASSAPQSGSAFGGGAKPAPGFGLFAQATAQNQTQSQPQPPAAEPAKPTSGFGQTAFGSTSSSGFGKSSFGQPAFGQSSFGQPSFGKPGFGASPMATTPATPTAPSAASTSAFGSGGGFGSYASSGFSSFGAAAKDKPSEPIWKTASADKPADMQPKSVFGGATFGAPQPQAQPASTPPPAPAPAPAPPPPKTPPPPVPPARSPPAISPSPSPPPVAPSPATSPTAPPKASAFGFTTTSSAAPAASAFSNLKSVDSPFAPSKLNPGHGLFSTFNKETSPFANPPKPASGGAFSQPVSAFGGPSTPPKPAASGSVFGQTSSLGSGRSVFGQSSFGAPSTPPASTPSPSTTPQTTPAASSAFSAFSGSDSPFGKFASPSKAFGDLLREGSDGKDKETPKKPVSAFDNLPKTPEAPKAPAETPKSAFGPSTSSETKSTTPGKAKADESSADLSKSTTSVASSYVEVSRDEEDEEEADEDEDQQGPASPGSEAEEARDDISDFLSSDAYSEQDEEETAEPGRGQVEETEDEEESAEEEQEEEEVDEEEAEESTAEDKKPVEPTSVPLPPSEPSSRAPSATPRPSHPSIRIEPGTPEKKEDKSTTPPGSPAKSPSPQPPLFQPAPNAPLPSPSPSPTFGIGLGRPSTRPLRSSPLASAPVSLQDEEGGEAGISAPSTKPHPASPKTPFGQWKSPAVSPLDSKSASPFSPLPAPVFTKPAPAEPEKEAVKKEARPKIPPLLSAFGKPSAPVFSPPSAFAPASAFPSASTSASTSAFSPSSTFAPPSAFSVPAPPKVPAMSMPPPSQFGSFAPPPPPASVKTEGASAFGFGAPPVFKQPAPAPTPAPAPAPAPAPVLPAPEKGMQEECANLVTVLQNELQELKVFADQAAKQRDVMSKSVSGEGSGLSIDEVAKLGKEIKAAAKDVLGLEALIEGHRMSIREFESDMIKAKTRKEEILRFDKAKSDAEFAKMLKARSLSPEYIEMQNQLRKDVRAMRTSIEQMEGNLQEAKKRLNEVKTGRPRLRPPSLDTVSRTYRNIEIALDQQAYDVQKLSSKLSKLDLDALASTPPQIRDRDKRLPDDARRSREVTPHVASTTAAALNAERSAQKLKMALLAARQQPLLNTKAATPSANANVPVAFSTPGKKPGVGTPTPFGNGFSLSGLGLGSSPSPGAGLAIPVPVPFSVPPFDPEDSPTPAARHHGSGTRHHGKSVKLKSSPSGAPKPPASFDWGPLPTANMRPLSTLPVDLRSFKPPTAQTQTP
ncbi:hypothetical protein DENSPDRAFT_238123 [Dentipellis sp. KUC8613]|nr:hypothetical protein DENSPDRAFT_238123 [Dentipellis sp. KUC8613]